MCMQCVRADRREAEGRPARWQQRTRVLYVDFPPPDLRRLEHAFREVGRVAERAGTTMREVGDTLTVTYPAAPTPAQLERATDVSGYFRDFQFNRDA